MGSFSTALSGLTAFSLAIDVTGNNLANINTAGFKASTVNFHDLVSQSLGDGATQVGFGVGAPTTMAQFTQGALQSTGGPLDAAIQGDGFFVVQNSAGQTEYTRGGNFSVNTGGELTTATGELVQGWSMTGGVLDTNLPLGPINIPVGSLAPPQATSSASISLNLDAAAVAGSANGTFSTTVQIYDSLGNAHTLTYTFSQTTTPNQWTYSASIPPGDTTSPMTPLTGTLTFDSNGNLVSPAATDTPAVINIPGLTDGASDMNVTWNLYNGVTPDITQYDQTSATSAVTQNGSAASNLANVSLQNGGEVLATYANGQQVVVGQMAMAEIRNPQSLIASGDSCFQASALTALPAIGLPGSGGRGTVLGGDVESSTVDIATEFTNLIIYQQGYQANAKVIQTMNTLSQTTVNLIGQ
jgi:flagellar hook protein FlgE